MSRKRKTKNSPQRIIRIGLILLIIITTLFITKEIINRIIKNDEEQLSETVSQGEKVEEKEEEEEKKKENGQNESAEKQIIKSYDGEDPNRQPELTGTITTTRVSGDNLIIRIEIDQFLTSGTCDLILTQNEKTYSEKTSIFADASTSTCEGFNVPITNLKSGNWQIQIILSSSEKTGKIEGEVDI